MMDTKVSTPTAMATTSGSLLYLSLIHIFVLLHSTSSTNAEIMDDLLTKWEEMGYTFGSLEDLNK